MRKKQKNKLDRFAETLDEMERENKTLKEMVAWLKQAGATACTMEVSRFLSARRKAQVQRFILENIRSAAEQCAEIEKAFRENPAPALDTVAKLLRVIILKLSTDPEREPEILKVADQLTRTALQVAVEHTKMEQRERALSVTEQKFQRETCALYLKIQADKRAMEIAAGPGSNAEKIEQLGELIFGEDWK